MITYGTNTKRLSKKRIPGEKCPSCESKDVYVIGLVKYTHIFWIPIFPYSKKVKPVCANCNLEINKKDIPQRMIDKISSEKKIYKIPFHLYSGAVIIASLIYYVIYSNSKHNEEVANNIKNLISKDVVVFKNKDLSYTFGKVTHKKSDTVFFNFSNYVYEGRAPSESDYNSERMNVKDFYNPDEYFFRQKKIDSLYLLGEIHDLYR